MSAAETLREAARLMRERAQAATAREAGWDAMSADAFWNPSGSDRDRMVGYVICDAGDDDPPVATSDIPEVATHIASWHPAVALAVADLLDAGATSAEQPMTGEDVLGWLTLEKGAERLARVYLGEVTE